MAHRLSLFLFALLCAGTALAGELVPFRGVWQGSTVSATPISPNVVLVVASGTGNATQLGSFEMTSPHYTYLDTFIVEGTQDFTGANGDTLNASFTGQLFPGPGYLEGTLAAVITGGTGRFAGATGSYDFHIIARPAAFGFDSTATIDGVISTAGSGD
jgi:hypothetical protein